MRILGSLRGLRVQLLVWTVLPLTLVLVLVAITGITTHQQSMRVMVEELDARSARLAAARLSEAITERAAFLQSIAANPAAASMPATPTFFDGGVAGWDTAGARQFAFPSTAAWQARTLPPLPPKNVAPQLFFSPFFLDPAIGRYAVLMGWVSPLQQVTAGVVSLEQLGLADLMAQAGSPGSANEIVFLVDSAGKVIYHPDPAQVGQNLRHHEGVQAVIRGQAGATYHQEPDGQEVVVGYAPVPGPNWGLIVQEPWENLIAPLMRLSLLAPLAVVAAALVSGLAVSFGLHYVVRPLQALDRQATRLAWGDFTAVTDPVGGIEEIEDLRRTMATMAAQIQRYQAGMRDYMAAITAAQEEERKRLARELHDETVQSLIALGHRIEMAQKALDKDPEIARRRLVELSQLAADTQKEVRRFGRALRPLYLEDLGFVPALEMLAQEMERNHHLPAPVKIEGEVRRLPPALELTAYRMAQEGLNNVVRHAQAGQAWLTVTFAPTELRLQLRDNGQGFTPPVNPVDLAHQGHFGLMGLHERALLFGGRLEIRSKPGAGTTLDVFLPLG